MSITARERATEILTGYVRHKAAMCAEERRDAREAVLLFSLILKERPLLESLPGYVLDANDAAYGLVAERKRAEALEAFEEWGELHAGWEYLLAALLKRDDDE